MIVGVVKETFEGERRVALTPAVVSKLVKGGATVQIESGAGVQAGFPDGEYESNGATIAPSRKDVFAAAEVICQVRTLGANPDAGKADLDLLRSGQIVIGHADPLTDAAPNQAAAAKGVTTFAMELMPRITRAQSMDVLSSQDTVSGYEAVLLAASHLPKMFPMLMTAAGTLAPARVFIIGAGVAGLQAISVAKRLGGVVLAYDIRPVVKEQVESLGGKFLEIELEAAGSEDKGGYAKARDDEFYRRQAEQMTQSVAESDVVITTAAVPGKKAPVLVSSEMIRGMSPGSVIVDLAAERGGNCEPTKADEIVDFHGVKILGPTNLPAAAPYHASQMYARNVATFLDHLTNDGQLTIDMSDEITEHTLLTRDGRIVQRRVCELLGLDPPPAEAGSAPGADEGSTD